MTRASGAGSACHNGRGSPFPARRIDRCLRLVPHGNRRFTTSADRARPLARARVHGAGARIGGVFTPPRLRRRGYASACVAGVTRKLLEEGRKAVFLYAESQNRTTNHIYESLGYQFVCDWQEYDMNPAAD